jgi:phosphocarrier protein HPr|tara:strand:- start:106 stop:522 length:417 start_codon:yes stop_codon:yes gene_type:complete
MAVHAAELGAKVNSEKPVSPTKCKKVGQSPVLTPECAAFCPMSTGGNNGSRVSRDVVVQNKLGLHARPASMFVKLATRFECEIFVEKEGEEVNGKSIMGLMMLAAGPGTMLTLHAEGGDADQAISELEQLVTRNFEEE